MTLLRVHGPSEWVSGSGRHVLVIEDDILVGKAAVRLLHLRGWHPTLVTCCADARRLPGPFDAAVIDIDLPDGNGVDLAIELLQKLVLAQLVFFTATTDPGVLSRARGVGRVVLKSEGAEALLRSLEQPEERSAPPSSMRVAPHTAARGAKRNGNGG